MSYHRSRSRHQSRPHSPSGSRSPTLVDSAGPASRTASTIDLPREQDFPESHERSYSRSQPYGHGNSQPYNVRSRRSKNEKESLAKGAIVLGLLAAAAGAAHLLAKREERKREERHRQEQQYEKSRRRDRRRKRDEDARSDRYRQAQSRMEDWQERTNRPRLTNEPYDGSSRGHSRRDIEWHPISNDPRDQRSSRYDPDKSRK